MRFIVEIRYRCRGLLRIQSRLTEHLSAAICLVLILVSNTTATDVRPDEAFNAARNWVDYSAGVLSDGWNGSVNAVPVATEALLSAGDTLAFVFHIDPSGYVAIAKYREMSPIIAYSTTENLDLDAAFGFAGILRSDLQIRCRYVDQLRSDDLKAARHHGAALAIQANQDRWDIWDCDTLYLIPGWPDISTTRVQDAGPLLQSTWHQSPPYNLYCPIGNNNAPCFVGCVATATAQIMRYWQWPPAGTDSHSYWWDGDGTAPAQWLTANFSDPYDWSNMLLSYAAGYTLEEAEAVAELCYEVGVAYEMMYSATGSGAYTNRCLDILPQHFGYATDIAEEQRAVHSAESWVAMIQPEIDAGRPLLYRFYQGGWGAHAIVCDGWRVSGDFDQLHFNYGWGGAYDNWYNVDELYPLTPDYVDHQTADRGIQPRLEQPPEVAAAFPTGNELNVPVSTVVSATFDLEMDPSTLHGGSFVVDGRSSGPHQGLIDYNPVSRTATFTPVAAFDYGEEVMAGLSTEVSSAAGCRMLRSYQWTFTTEVVPGDGSFAEAVNYPVVGRPIALHAADLNHDSHVDLAIVAEDTSEVTIMLNTGSGEFVRGSYCQCGGIPSDICAADLDEDGDIDLVTANELSHNVTVIKNNGDGTFGYPVPYRLGGSPGPNSVVATDLDGDNRIDVAAANSGDCAMSVYFNGGPGSFWRRDDYLFGAPGHTCINSADMDGEAHPDVVAGDPNGNSVRVFLHQWQSGSFGYPLSCDAGLSPHSVVTADLDGDGDMDLAAADTLTGQLAVIANNGDLSFSLPSLYWVGDKPTSIIAADCDGDGDLDLINTLRGSGEVSALRNSGGATFASQSLLPVGERPGAVIAADLDSDGDLDLVTANTSSQDISILLNESATDIIQTSADELPRNFALYQNYPNPFNPATEIAFALPRAAQVRLDVFNVMGQRVTTLIDERRAAGYHSVIWNAVSSASGMYFFRIEAGDFSESRKMLLVK
ncbi:MAG: C10 family peptidase [Candidatus Zixiibacteriota bacterium]|nr:MAG: C10 family peptidase [candidate division Zixibacteria bacterium]